MIIKYIYSVRTASETSELFKIFLNSIDNHKGPAYFSVIIYNKSK